MIQDNDHKLDDAGLGAAALSGLRLYEQASRASGRTHRMIMGLTEGATVFCADGEFRSLSLMIKELRPDLDGKVDVFTWSRDAEYRVRGRATQITMTHRLWLKMYEAAIERVRDDMQALSRQAMKFEPLWDGARQASPVAPRWGV